MDISVTDRETPGLTIVVPCFNEALVLRQTIERLLSVIVELTESQRIAGESRICMVDDGSTDGTWDLICDLCQSERECCGIRLTRNFGHQHALLAGLLSAPGDILVSIDADLQDDPSVIMQMVDAYRGGADIVFGVRDDRSSDTILKRTTARAYYKLLKLLGVPVIEDHADFRLLSRRAVEALRDYPEVNLFLRALVHQLGFQQSVVYYKRAERAAGQSKYSIRKMLGLGLNGVTSFSAAPLRLLALTGLLISAGSVAVTLWALWIRLFTDLAVPGWASSVVPMYLFGGLQLLAIGIVGEYVAKLYLEAKARPRFMLWETRGFSDESRDAEQYDHHEQRTSQGLGHAHKRDIR